MEHLNRIWINGIKAEFKIQNLQTFWGIALRAEFDR